MSNAGRKSIYDPAMCAKVVEIMAGGASIVEVAAELRIGRRTLYHWIDEKDEANYKPEFADAIDEGVELCQAWWEKTGRTGLFLEKFNATVWIYNMKNRFKDDWRDKSEHEHTGKDGGAIKTEDATDPVIVGRKIAFVLAKAAAILDNEKK